jgi:hypothetical protein
MPLLRCNDMRPSVPSALTGFALQDGRPSEGGEGRDGTYEVDRVHRLAETSWGIWILCMLHAINYHKHVCL